MSLALGLVGYPLEGSLSPKLHAENLRRLGLQGEYLLYRIPALPAGQAALEAIIARLRRGELQGLNVTLPHKQSVLPLVDHLTPQAQRIGAVNTLFVQDHQVWGDNTDAPGFWADLQASFPELFAGGAPAGRALVLGAGGAARAVVYMLLFHGWQVALAARRIEQAAAFRQAWPEFANRLTCLPLWDLGWHVRQAPASDAGWGVPFSLLVNASSAGMLPHADTCPWPGGLPLPPGACVYDLVYKPPRTLLLQLAEAAGLPAVNGSGMLEKQAALSMRRWTGRSLL
jgi:shikimate dehydrogenase